MLSGNKWMDIAYCLFVIISGAVGIVWNAKLINPLIITLRARHRFACILLINLSSAMILFSIFAMITFTAYLFQAVQHSSVGYENQSIGDMGSLFACFVISIPMYLGGISSIFDYILLIVQRFYLTVNAIRESDTDHLIKDQTSQTAVIAISIALTWLGPLAVRVCVYLFRTAQEESRDQFVVVTGTADADSPDGKLMSSAAAVSTEKMPQFKYYALCRTDETPVPHGIAAFFSICSVLSIFVVLLSLAVSRRSQTRFNLSLKTRLHIRRITSLTFTLTPIFFLVPVLITLSIALFYLAQWKLESDLTHAFYPISLAVGQLFRIIHPILCRYQLIRSPMNAVCPATCHNAPRRRSLRIYSISNQYQKTPSNMKQQRQSNHLHADTSSWAVVQAKVPVIRVEKATSTFSCEINSSSSKY